MLRMNVDKSANEVNNQDREYEDFPQVSNTTDLNNWRANVC